MASNKIKCTFEECYQAFDTVEAMKKHKSKADDEVHEFYCKKCDEDCEDDIAYLIHQIQSRKHIACPVCGAEFKSEGGRDRHVGINHRRKQEIRCPGCKVMFESASALMGHIEGDKCKTITRDDFHKHRAEKEIEREIIEEITGSVYQNSTAITAGASQVDSINSGISLLDNERVHLERDWQGNLQFNPSTSAYGQANTQGDHLSKGLSELSVNQQYPALRATRADRSNLTQSDTSSPLAQRRNTNDLMDLQEEPEVRPGQPKTLIGNHNVWGNNRRLSSQPKSQGAPSNNLLDTDSSVNLLESTLTADTAATRGSQTTTNAWTNDSNSNINSIPPAARPENQDPNAPFAQVQTVASKRPVASRLDLHRYWDSIQGCYICPGSRCGQRIYSVKGFEEHLLSGAHVVGKVQCPSCLKKFKTATALVAHAESGSTRCDLRNSAEYDLAMRNITAGLIKVDGAWMDGTVKYESVPVSDW